ncbi:hypothetical protein N7453_006250 [Penicillium expansum]|nr:hypothetical protein N7453_006250 [Penicillium expansum]
MSSAIDVPALAKTPNTTLFPQFMPAESATPVTLISLHLDQAAQPYLVRDCFSFIRGPTPLNEHPPDSLDPPLPSYTKNQAPSGIC